MTPTEEIAHEMLTRQIDLMRYERSVRRDVVALLENMQREVTAKLKAADLSEMGKRELNALLAEIEAILARDYELAAEKLPTAEVAENEAAWLLLLLAAYGVPKRLPESHARELQHSLLVGGLTVAEAFARQARDLSDKLKALLRVAAAGGDNWQAMQDYVALAFKRAKQYAATVSATWISTVSNQAAYRVGLVNPMVKGWRHMAVLDGRTSSVCMHRHGRLWNKSKEPLGHDMPFRAPPIHPNCRSRLTWVLDPDDDFDGISGEDWVKGRTLEQLQEQFGKGIGQMLYDGDITLADAVKQGGLVPVTLQELRLKYAQPVHSSDFLKRFNELAPEIAAAKSHGISLKSLRQSAADKVWFAGTLDDATKSLLQSTTNVVWVSEDTLIKQIFNHPELSADIYKRLPDMLGRAETVIRIGDSKIAFFKYDNVIYEAIVKTTANREELYLVSLFKTNAAEVRRMMKKGHVLKSR